MTTWTIVNMERDASTGFVSTVHWTCSDVDGDYSGRTYGSLGLSGELVTPYEDLTEETVIGWVHEAMGEETVAAHEASVAAKIAYAKEPKVATGMPWQNIL
jgi:predicted sugar kinase